VATIVELCGQNVSIIYCLVIQTLLLSVDMNVNTRDIMVDLSVFVITHRKFYILAHTLAFCFGYKHKQLIDYKLSH